MGNRVLLFAMTGLGNTALRTLCADSSVDVAGVFTPSPPQGQFPYYQCEQLHEAVARKRLPLFEGHSMREKATHDLVRSLAPDLIVVATYSQIIPGSIITLPRLGVINMHPSLLPKYRGSIPTVCVLLNGEKRTGVTGHFIEDEKIDAGRIITQAGIDIEPDDNDGSLRRKLSKLVEPVLTEVLRLVRTRERKSFPEQNELEATYCQKRTAIFSEIDTIRPFDEINNKIRALTPYPGAYVSVGNQRYRVTSATLRNSDTPEKSASKEGNSIIITNEYQTIEFHIKKAS